jgi:hypothetical protein
VCADTYARPPWQAKVEMDLELCTFKVEADYITSKVASVEIEKPEMKKPVEIEKLGAKVFETELAAIARSRGVRAATVAVAWALLLFATALGTVFYFAQANFDEPTLTKMELDVVEMMPPEGRDAALPTKPAPGAALAAAAAPAEVVAERLETRLQAVMEDRLAAGTLADVEAIAIPSRAEGAPIVVEVTYALEAADYSAMDGDTRAAFEGRLVADIAAAAGVPKARVVVEYVRAGSLTVGFAILDPAAGSAGGGAAFEIVSELHTDDQGFRCLPAIIVNDFDAAVVPTVAAGAEGAGFVAGRAGEKPYFHDWFGELGRKDFHHDDALNKGKVSATYTVALPTPGCYVAEEWHLGGNQFCLAYMPRAVPMAVQHDGGPASRGRWGHSDAA